MNWRSFVALFARDLYVARRNAFVLMIQIMLQPLLWLFIFGRVMIQSGIVAAQYKELVLTGTMAVAMVATGAQTVAIPVISDFQFTREIEDRLLAPIGIGWIAAEKMAVGTLLALISGAVVAIASRFLLGAGLALSFHHPVLFGSVSLLLAVFAAAGGLFMGCSVGLNQAGFVFPIVMAPMTLLGCVYYPWSAISTFPSLQRLVLLNPLVYACEGLRAAAAPQYPHFSASLSITTLVLVDVMLIIIGLYRFYRRAII